MCSVHYFAINAPFIDNTDFRQMIQKITFEMITRSMLLPAGVLNRVYNVCFKFVRSICRHGVFQVFVHSALSLSQIDTNVKGFYGRRTENSDVFVFCREKESST